MQLSVLDFDTVGTAVNLVSALDDLGYRRYWLGEHHSSYQCANPLLLGALLAATTRGLRLGSGGVCLTYHSPFKVAEDARLIEFMLPDHFDLGVTRGLMTDEAMVYSLLDGRTVDSLRDYREKFEELHGLVTGRLPGNHPLHERRPYLEAGPPIWALGMGSGIAGMAARLGTGFCFSLHHAPAEIDGSSLIGEYRDRFVPSPEFSEPAVIVVVSCICAPSEEEARKLQHSYVEQTAGFSPELRDKVFKTPMIVGTPTQCRERFEEISRRLAVDELMIVDLVGSKNYSARTEMYRLLAAEFDLAPRLADEEEEEESYVAV